MSEEQPAEKIYTTESASNSDTGKKRSNNEDWVAGFEPTNPQELQESGSLYIVADGVGGASKGEQASQYAAKKVLYDFFQDTSLEPRLRLQRSIRKACNEIYEYSQESNLSRMATTMVAANVRENKLTVANVGDSRCYLIRSGKVTQITQDHNFVGELIRNGSLSPEEARNAKVRNTLLRSLGGEPDVDVDIFGEFDLFPGDIILLCSDGLTRYAEDADILRICSSGSAEKISEQLVEFANERGGADNTSVYVIKISPEGVRIIDDEGQTIPEAVSWDSITSDKRGGIHKAPRINSTSKRKRVVTMLLAIIALFLTSGAFYLSNKGKSGASKPLPPPIASPSASPSPSATWEITPTQTLAVIPVTPIVTSPTSSTTAFVPTETLESTTMVPNPPVITVTPTVDTFMCVHKVQDNENISTIFEPFSPPLTYPQKVYNYFQGCDIEKKTCRGDKLPIDNPNAIFTYMFIIIPVDQTTCVNVGEGFLNTYWMLITP